MSLLLERGERGLLVGQTGSGKTQDAIFQLRHAKQWPVIILDTKIEDAFFGLPEDDDTIDLIQSFDELEKYAKQNRKHFADYILVRPSIDETQDMEVLDNYCRLLYNKFGACFIYFDELYNWHNGGRCTNGMIGLYTRGRSKGKTVLGATQRPAWISRFCLTESQKFYIHNLTDARDWKTLAEVIPGFMEVARPPKYHFNFYEVGKDKVQLFSPVPFQTLDKSKVFKHKWL